MVTIILDFDGTIADTRQSIIQTVRHTLKVLNLPIVSDEKIINVIGLPLRDTFIEGAGITDENVISEVMKIYRASYNDISLATIRLFPHVADTLQLLWQEGYKLTIASSKGKQALATLLDRLGISIYISHIFGEQDVANKKPAPDMALHILQKTSCNPSDALVVGDTVFDIQMGQGAGCKTCGVTYGNHSEQRLREQGADFIINDFGQLYNIIGNRS